MNKNNNKISNKMSNKNSISSSNTNSNNSHNNPNNNNPTSINTNTTTTTLNRVNERSIDNNNSSTNTNNHKELNMTTSSNINNPNNNNSTSSTTTTTTTRCNRKHCPYCNGTNIIKKGFNKYSNINRERKYKNIKTIKTSRQKYMCNDCKKYFSNTLKNVIPSWAYKADELYLNKMTLADISKNFVHKSVPTILKYFKKIREEKTSKMEQIFKERSYEYGYDLNHNHNDDHNDEHNDDYNNYDNDNHNHDHDHNHDHYDDNTNNDNTNNNDDGNDNNLNNNNRDNDNNINDSINNININNLNNNININDTNNINNTNDINDDNRDNNNDANNNINTNTNNNNNKNNTSNNSNIINNNNTTNTATTTTPNQNNNNNKLAITRKVPINIVFDGTFLNKRNEGFLVFIGVFKDNTSKVIYYKYIKHETISDLEDSLNYIENNLNYHIKSFTLDNRPGFINYLKKRYENEKIPIQLCQYHQKHTITRHLTLNPKLNCSKEIKNLINKITNITKEEFEEEFNNILDKYHSFLNQRSKIIEIDEKTNKIKIITKGYKHKRIRSAIYSIKKNLDYLFSCKDKNNISLHIPNTSNHCEGMFGWIKTKMKVHRGMSKETRNYLFTQLLIA